ncbi:uncharacterized protein M6B38_270095 [Iris pallida]|uniref:Photolyase/cryptochrome alpha/beta domain-containing protein n=1 Tax=Iris pallida TaxID=29817 RepID=A0AAX6I9A4_IRIPA|nr:uncharacterized protein M6B38_270095 [Iris pallida]
MASFSLSSLHGPTRPRFLSRSPGDRRSPRSRRRRTLFCRAAAEGAAVVWMKRDLRLDDHPGLAAAAAEGRRPVVPVYVFDRRILSGFSDEMLELLLFALEDLRKVLKDQGSDLLICFGSAEDVILKLVNEVKATHVFVEDEVEYNLRRVVDAVKSSFSSVEFSWGDPNFVFWRTPFYDVENSKDLPASYNGFQKLKLSLSNPISSPSLPHLNMELDRGTLPSFDDVKKYLNGNLNEEDDTWSPLKEMSAEAILRKARKGQAVEETGIVNGIESFEVANNARWTLAKSVFASQKGNLVRGGTDTVLNGLAAYLRYLEGTSRDDYQELHEKLLMAETRGGASFGTLFGPSLYLGTISRRRIHYEAIKYEKERNAGFVSPFGYSAASVAAAVETVCSMEWYQLLALRSQTRNEAIYPIRIWNWKGYLIQYTVVGDDGPPILFVHGFGAFLEHFRDNISSMADSGHRVWGITLLGFGRSEKPNFVYSELMWAELLRDFIVDVVGEPVHLVGNSIGGYFSASVAGLWPSLAKSLVLINTAGSVVPDYSRLPLVEARKTSGTGIAWLGSRLLLLYLRLRAGNILKNCYPNNTRRADDWLINEIVRSSYDPGVLVVLESVFNFNLSVPLNYFLDSFGGKVLVIQGMKDPLSNSKLRLSKIRENCGWTTIRELDAGHCPHDEVPDEVNSILSEWTRTVETESKLETAKAM